MDNVIVDYAEIEINPDGIKKLENNLERQMETPDENEKWWKECLCKEQKNENFNYRGKWAIRI